MKQDVTIFWFRRDLRLNDNAGFFNALKNNSNVLPLFIFDSAILGELEKDDARVTFIYKTIEKIKSDLNTFGADILVKYGNPLEIWQELFKEFKINAVYTNGDYESYAQKRDENIAKLAIENGAQFHSFKDHVIFEKNEVLKDNGSPYTVFTPYSKKWKSLLNSFYLKSFPTEKYFHNFLKLENSPFLSLNEMGFVENSIVFPELKINEKLIAEYSKKRDFPAEKGTSKLGLHLRFGTISIRELARKAKELNETYLNELIWRDFYAMILYHFPQVEKNAFKPAYDRIEWINNAADFEKWKNGQTGYPIVDAGMRELNATGFMHNRVRMITASFLTKHLLIDWRWGEAYFAEKLLDFDLASNNGGWQWAAGSGCDAAPYFRVFNPELQTQKFDAKLLYVRKWVPEFQNLNYTKPMVDHKFARERVLKVYKEALS